MSESRLSFKEMCTKFDVTPRTLRYYEYIELLSPEREVARLTLILRGRRWGFALEEIRQWLLIYEEKGTDAQLQSWIELADRQLSELEAQKAQLEQSIAELRETRDKSARALKANEGSA